MMSQEQGGYAHSGANQYAYSQEEEPTYNPSNYGKIHLKDDEAVFTIKKSIVTKLVRIGLMVTSFVSIVLFFFVLTLVWGLVETNPNDSFFFVKILIVICFLLFIGFVVLANILLHRRRP